MIDPLYLENAIDSSSAESAQRTLRQAAGRARRRAADLDHEANSFRASARTAEASRHTTQSAGRFAVEVRRIERDATALRAKADAWDKMADQIVGSVPAGTRPEWAGRLEHGLPAAHRRPIDRGADGGTKEQITLPDGTTVFHKTYSAAEKGARHRVDAEELAALLAARLHAPVPRVHRLPGELGIYTDWVDGSTLVSDQRPEMLASAPARRLGLLDILTVNTDRTDDNMLVTADGQLVGVDQALAWTDAEAIVREPATAAVSVLRFMKGPGARYFADAAASRFVGNPLTAADVTELREQLHALRPEFLARGRGTWLDASLHVLDLIAPHATGEQPLLG